RLVEPAPLEGVAEALEGRGRHGDPAPVQSAILEDPVLVEEVRFIAPRAAEQAIVLALPVIDDGSESEREVAAARAALVGLDGEEVDEALGARVPAARARGRGER